MKSNFSAEHSTEKLLPKHIDFGTNTHPTRRKYLEETHLTEEMQNQINDLKALHDDLTRISKLHSKFHKRKQHTHYEPVIDNRRFHKLWDSDSVDIPKKPLCSKLCATDESVKYVQTS